MIKLKSLTVKMLRSLLVEYELPTTGVKTLLVESLSEEVGVDEINEKVLNNILEQPTDDLRSQLNSSTSMIVSLSEKVNDTTNHVNNDHRMTTPPLVTPEDQPGAEPTADVKSDEYSDHHSVVYDEINVNVNALESKMGTKNIRDNLTILPEFLRTMSVKTFPELHAALRDNVVPKIRSGRANGSNEKQSTIFQQKPTNKLDTKAQERKQLTCYNCNKVGHISIRCPEPQKKNRCFKCNKTGHQAKECGVRTKATVAKIKTTSEVPPWVKVVNIDGAKFSAFVNSGSDISIISETTVSKYDVYQLQDI